MDIGRLYVHEHPLDMQTYAHHVSWASQRKKKTADKAAMVVVGVLLTGLIGFNLYLIATALLNQ